MMNTWTTFAAVAGYGTLLLLLSSGRQKRRTSVLQSAQTQSSHHSSSSSSSSSSSASSRCSLSFSSTPSSKSVCCCVSRGAAECHHRGKREEQRMRCSQRSRRSIEMTGTKRMKKRKRKEEEEEEGNPAAAAEEEATFLSSGCSIPGSLPHPPSLSSRSSCSSRSTCSCSGRNQFTVHASRASLTKECHRCESHPSASPCCSSSHLLIQTAVDSILDGDSNDARNIGDDSYAGSFEGDGNYRESYLDEMTAHRPTDARTMLSSSWPPVAAAAAATTAAAVSNTSVVDGYAADVDEDIRSKRNNGRDGQSNHSTDYFSPLQDNGGRNRFRVQQVRKSEGQKVRRSKEDQNVGRSTDQMVSGSADRQTRKSAGQTVSRPDGKHFVRAAVTGSGLEDDYGEEDEEKELKGRSVKQKGKDTESPMSAENSSTQRHLRDNKSQENRANLLISNRGTRYESNLQNKWQEDRNLTDNGKWQEDRNLHQIARRPHVKDRHRTKTEAKEDKRSRRKKTKPPEDKGSRRQTKTKEKEREDKGRRRTDGVTASTNCVADANILPTSVSCCNDDSEVRRRWRESTWHKLMEESHNKGIASSEALPAASGAACETERVTRSCPHLAPIDEATAEDAKHQHHQLQQQQQQQNDKNREGSTAAVNQRRASETPPSVASRLSTDLETRDETSLSGDGGGGGGGGGGGCSSCDSINHLPLSKDEMHQTTESSVQMFYSCSQSTDAKRRKKLHGRVSARQTRPVRMPVSGLRRQMSRRCEEDSAKELFCDEEPVRRRFTGSVVLPPTAVSDVVTSPASTAEQSSGTRSSFLDVLNWTFVVLLLILIVLYTLDHLFGWSDSSDGDAGDDSYSKTAQSSSCNQFTAYCD